MSSRCAHEAHLLHVHGHGGGTPLRPPTPSPLPDVQGVWVTRQLFQPDFVEETHPTLPHLHWVEPAREPSTVVPVPGPTTVLVHWGRSGLLPTTSIPPEDPSPSVVWSGFRCHSTSLSRTQPTLHLPSGASRLKLRTQGATYSFFGLTLRPSLPGPRRRVGRGRGPIPTTRHVNRPTFGTSTLTLLEGPVPSSIHHPHPTPVPALRPARAPSPLRGRV